jgi:arylsulfatase A-like enzyme
LGGLQTGTELQIYKAGKYPHHERRRILCIATCRFDTQIYPQISVPGLTPLGSHCTKAVSHIDLYPTLVDLCGLPDFPNEKTNGRVLEGDSLKALLEDPEQGEWQGPNAALTSVRGDSGIHRSIRTENYRYTLCGNGEEELYDHRTDSHEWHNLATDERYAAIKLELRDKLIELIGKWK